MKLVPHEYQNRGAAFMVQHPFAGLLKDPGLGKTATTLAAVKTFKELGLGHRTLVVAPLSVALTVWEPERDKWDQFHDLSISVVVGTESQRRKALAVDADVYVTNIEAIPWISDIMRRKLRVSLREKLRELEPGTAHTNLSKRIQKTIELEKLRKWRDFFDNLVIDESTNFKSSKALCFRRAKQLLDFFERRYILTGDFFENSLEDLWSQVYLLDRGERLGETKRKFLERYFLQGGYKNREWVALPESKDIVLDKIKDITLRLDADDWLNLPPLTINDVWVKLEPKVQQVYREFEKELFAELPNTSNIKEDGQRSNTIQTLSAAGRYLMCRQIANGGVYDGDIGEVLRPGKDRPSLFVHDAKTRAVQSIINELNGKPILILYQFWHDLRRLEKVFGVRPALNSDTKRGDFNSIVTNWNADRIPILFAQPQSMSHGLNLQDGSGRDVVFFGLTDSLGVYQQAYKRIYRQGVDSAVRVHRVLTRATVDVLMRRRVDGKAKYQKSILNALRAYSNER